MPHGVIVETPELGGLHHRYERVAARFAAKEAGMKAIGTGWRRGVGWHDFEVANLPSGKPVESQ